MEVRAGAGFVAERPEGDTGMVLIALNHAYHAAQDGRRPVRMACQIEPGLPRAVALDIRLVHYIETVFVAQLVKARGVRVVTKPHGIDVEALHEFDVAAHPFLRHYMAEIGIVLMAV